MSDQPTPPSDSPTEPSAPASHEPAAAQRSTSEPHVELDADSISFIEDFASAWESMNTSRMDGRVLGLLMITDQPYMSAKQIGDLLQASSGAISMSTRALVSVGFINRHTVPGDRRHYFRVEDDVWGAFLAGERAYLHRMSSVIQTGLAIRSGQQGRPRVRLRNADRYMTWLEGYHRKMLEDWRRYRDTTDGAADPGPPSEEER